MSRSTRAHRGAKTSDVARVALAARDPAGARRAWVGMLVISAATALVYSNTLDASFHFDDLTSIVQNEGLRELRRQWPPSGNRWVGYLSFAFNYRLGGLNVFGYHLVNLAVHACNGLLVFWLAALTLRTPAVRRAELGPLLRRYLPIAAGLLFAVHPLATQAVTYVVQRFASLATLFYLLSLAAYVLARLALETDRPPRVRVAGLYCLALLAAGAAMRTKEISFTLPLVVAGYEALFFGLGRRLTLVVPIAAIALLVPLGLAARGQDLAGVLGEASRLAAETQRISRPVYLLTQSRVVVTYIRMLLLPVGQNVDHDFPLSQSLTSAGVVPAIAVLLAVAVFAVFLLVRARRTNRAAGVIAFSGVAWFFLTLSVESSVVPIRDVIFEHRVYLPSAGAAVALATALLWLVERLRPRASLRVQCAAALVVTAGPLGVATYARNLVWKDEVTLWSDAVAKSPRKARPHNELGVALARRGELEGGIRELRQAIELAPGLAKAHANLGVAYMDAGLLEDGSRELREAVLLAPDMAEGHAQLGVVLEKQGRASEAVDELGRAFELRPTGESRHTLALAHNDLGAAHGAKGNVEDAAREYREAIRLEPGFAEAHTNLGAILVKQGRAAEGVEEHRRALELTPRPEIVLNLGIALEAAGRSSEAIAEYERFLDEAAQRYPERAAAVKGHIARLRAMLPVR